jgi:DNA end-binding protein Ku
MPTNNVRPIASLTISFGLVAIPVNLYPATLSTEKISFHFLRKKDGSRVKQRYVALNDGKVVDRAELTKGYEFAKGQYVTFSPQELKALEDLTTHSIDISQFVPLASVDPIYFEGTYFLAPDKGGAKPYSLLTSALAESKQCAVGRWISRGREHIVVIRSIRRALAMHQLHFPTEVRLIKDLGVQAADVSAAELKLADQLIHQLSAKQFDPREYVDEFHGRVEAAIQRKVQGKEISIAEPPFAPAKGNVVDLMQALKASLDARGRTPIADLRERRATKRAVSGEPRKMVRR